MRRQSLHLQCVIHKTTALGRWGFTLPSVYVTRPLLRALRRQLKTCCIGAQTQLILILHQSGLPDHGTDAAAVWHRDVGSGQCASSDCVLILPQKRLKRKSVRTGACPERARLLVECSKLRRNFRSFQGFIRK